MRKNSPGWRLLAGVIVKVRQPEAGYDAEGSLMSAAFDELQGVAVRLAAEQRPAAGAARGIVAAVFAQGLDQWLQVADLPARRRGSPGRGDWKVVSRCWACPRLRRWLGLAMYRGSLPHFMQTVSVGLVGLFGDSNFTNTETVFYARQPSSRVYLCRFPDFTFGEVQQQPCTDSWYCI